MKRGEVWWAELPPPVGPRPVVILTRDRVLPSIDSVVVALVTRTVRGVETEVRVGRREGLPSQSVINLDNLLTAPKRRLVRLMGACDKDRLAEVARAVRFSLGVE